MKILYFDCATGISGNMTIGALLEACNGEAYLRKELAKLNLPGYELKISKRDSHGINGIYFEVLEEGTDIPVDATHELKKDTVLHTYNAIKAEGEYGHHHHDDDHDHSHDHHHEHHHIHHHDHRSYKDIKAMIEVSSITDEAKKITRDIFDVVAAAEAKVHNKTIEEVDFHEVGAIDSIVDIVGTAILLDYIKPDKIIFSTICDGFGTILCAHGELGVPVPATAEIYKNKSISFKQINVDTELVTPTGAAIAGALATSYELMPAMTIMNTGIGVGKREIGRANVLRVYIGEIAEEAPKTDITVINSNIDDSTGEELGFVLEKLMSAGALDVSFAPIIMKKNRPAYRLEVICKMEDKDKLADIIFTETTTIGLRYYEVKREELQRSQVLINTELGQIRGKKVVTNTGKSYVYPEFSDLERISNEFGIPVKSVKAIFERGLDS